MRKITGRILFCLVLAASVWCADLLADRTRLNKELIRLHVVGASDGEEDQRIKLRVRDAIVAYLQDDMQAIRNTQEAKRYLQGKLSDLEQIAKSAEILGNAEQIVHYYRQEITRFLELETVTNMDMRRIIDHISVNKDGSVRVVLKKFEEMAVA